MENKDEQITVFGETNFRNQKVPFGIKLDDRRRHVYMIGKTGMGKSETLKHMIYDDIHNGSGLCIVDPHGDLAEEILSYIPAERINDVVYFNPSDINHPIAFNVLEKVDPDYRHLIASGLVGVFHKIWADSWGPRLEYLLRNTILALLSAPDSTLLGINRMFVDKLFRERVITKIDDPVVKQFWVDEYSNYTDKFAMEAIAPIQNKVGQFLSTSLIRNIVGQVKSSIDIRKLMDENKILILNLSKGRVGEDASSLLGAMMITKIQLSAMSRVDTPEAERKDFFLYVDEFQNFATESFANILSEARKYRLNLTLAHQYIEQLGETVAAAVFGNVGTLITFRVGANDAEYLEKEFTPYFLATDIVNIPKYNIYLKLMIDGIASDPFSASTLVPIPEEKWYNNEDKIIRVSRERYAQSRDEVESKIKKWSESSERIKEKQEEIRKLEKPTLYRGFCDHCGKPIELNFEPNLKLPIYCKDCLKDAQRGKISKDRIPDHAPRKKNPSLAPQPVSQLAKMTTKPEKYVSSIPSKPLTSTKPSTYKPRQEFIPQPKEDHVHKVTKVEPVKQDKPAEKPVVNRPRLITSKPVINKPRLVTSKPPQEKPSSKPPQETKDIKPGEIIKI